VKFPRISLLPPLLPALLPALLPVAIAVLLGLLSSQQVVAQPLPPLVEAASQGDWQAMQQLLNREMDANQSYGDGSTALHWAAHLDNQAAVQQLIAAGADVNAATDLGVTPLWLAAENANATITELLLVAGADPSIALLSGETPLMMASLSGSGAVARQLLAAGANPDVAVTRQQTALMWAAGRGHHDVVQALLDHGANVDARTEVRSEYVKTEKEQDSHPAYKIWIEEGGYNALMFAAAAGELQSARALLAAGSDPNGLSAYGLTPAILAAHGGNTGLLELLLDAGAATGLAPAGQSPLHVAVLRGNREAVELLLQHGADPDAVLQKPTPTRRQSADYHFHDSLVGATPLWLAARFKEPDIMAVLLQAGADPRAVNAMVYPAQRRGDNYIADEGEISILMAAVGMGNRRLRLSWGTPERRGGQVGRDQQALTLEAVQLAVQAGVDINRRDANGQSALDFARDRDYGTVVTFLELMGAD